MTLSRVLLPLACVTCSSSLEATVRGVAPEKQTAYDQKVQCISPAGESIDVPPSAVNDDFCDCADGADEPGTGACAGQEQTMFYCTNEGGTPRLIYSSRVDDGICDCCDGSDEAGLQARRPSRAACMNTCKEEGEKERQERALKKEKLTQGLAKKEKAIAKVKADRAVWEREAAALEASKSDLQASLDKALAAQAAAQSKEAAGEGASGGGSIQEQIAALKKTVEEQQKLIDQMRQEIDTLKARKAGGQPVQGDAAAEAGDGKKQVSEYAKWMEGAGSTPGAIESVEVAGGDDDEDEEDDTMSSSDADAEVSKFRKEIQDNSETAQDIRKKAAMFSDENAAHHGYADLVDKCLELNDGQYKYEVCFFSEAYQDSVLLGKWSSFTGARMAEFTGGQMCPGGPARMLRVLFECGSEEAVLDVIEPSRCVYEARISSPGACNHEDAQELEKPPVRHPRDEL